MRGLKKVAAGLYDRIIKIKGAPRQIALGFALGLFVGMTPFLGTHIIVSLVLASLLGWSRISAIIGVNITNVATAPFIYAINYWVGAKVTGLTTHFPWPASMGYVAFVKLLKASPLILVDLCVGGVILGLPVSVAGYYICLHAIKAYRRRTRHGERKLIARKPESQNPPEKDEASDNSPT